MSIVGTVFNNIDSLVETGRASFPLVQPFSMYGHSAIEADHLNCIAAVPTVSLCVCNAWLWGQLSFQTRVRSLGRWLEMSIRVVEGILPM